MPPQEKKQYIIQFVYVENGQIFSTGAMLDSEEKRNLERILNAYAYAYASAIEQPAVFEVKPVEQDFDAAVDEIMRALENEVSGDDRSQCQNCGRMWPHELLAGVEDLSMRVGPGEPMPSGECRACGAVCLPVQADKAR